MALTEMTEPAEHPASSGSGAPPTDGVPAALRRAGHEGFKRGGSAAGAAAGDPPPPVGAPACAGGSELDLATVLHALSDPVRLMIVAQLADGSEHTCGSLEVPVAKSTSSHHFRVLREAGVLAQRLDGKCRYNRLRVSELEQRFPGLLEAVLQASRA